MKMLASITLCLVCALFFSTAHAQEDRYYKEVAKTYRIVLCTDGNYAVEHFVTSAWYEWEECKPLDETRRIVQKDIEDEAETQRMVDRIPRVIHPEVIMDLNPFMESPCDGMGDSACGHR